LPGRVTRLTARTWLSNGWEPTPTGTLLCQEHGVGVYRVVRLRLQCQLLPGLELIDGFRRTVQVTNPMDQEDTRRLAVYDIRSRQELDPGAA
jgi:hypothetical protein